MPGGCSERQGVGGREHHSARKAQRSQGGGRPVAWGCLAYVVPRLPAPDPFHQLLEWSLLLHLLHSKIWEHRLGQAATPPTDAAVAAATALHTAAPSADNGKSRVIKAASLPAKTHFWRWRCSMVLLGELDLCVAPRHFDLRVFAHGQRPPLGQARPTASRTDSARGSPHKGATQLAAMKKDLINGPFFQYSPPRSVHRR